MFSLQQIIPHPLKENYQSQSDIWLKDISFHKGENYLITAPSGKGKSTFLHAIYGLRKDFDGTILIDDQSIQQFGLDDWAGLRQTKFSIVFQDLRLFPQLSGLENILLKNNLQLVFSIIEILEMAGRLGIKSIMSQSCGTMSYGQRQRIAILRALCQPFDYLLLDEPFSHLDDANIEKACSLIQEVCNDRKAGFLLVSLGETYHFDYQYQLKL